MPVTPFAEFRPDVSDYEGNTSRNITNVIPRGDGYGPIGAYSAITGALPAACRGMFTAHNTDGSDALFAGTATKLYKLNNTNGSWTDVSRSGGTYTSLAAQANWTFAQFNNFVFATQQNDKLQIFDLTSSTAFSDRADSNCPQAAYVTVVNSFLVLSGILANNVYRIQWSGLNDVSSSSAFTSGVNSSDFQDLADGGLVRGVSGGEYGVVFQDFAIRRLLYAPGAPYVFQIDRIAVDDGLLAPYSLIRGGNNIFWLSPTGFKMLAPGGVPTPIGKERVDRTFFGDADMSQLQLIIGANDPTTTRVYWGYKSEGGSANAFDKILIYDWALDRWSRVQGGGFVSGQAMSQMGTPSITLEGVDAAYGTNAAVFVSSITTSTSALVANSTAHGLSAGQGVTWPTSFLGVVAANTPYYVIPTGLTANAFQFSATGGVGAYVGSPVGSTSSATTTSSSAISYKYTSEEALNLGSLDDIINNPTLSLAISSTAMTVGLLNGSNLQATLETPEQGGDGTRLFVRGFRVVSDATTGTIAGSVSFRENPQAAFSYSGENIANARGYVPLRVSTRYARAKVRIPSATTWTYAAGVEFDRSPEGQR